MHNVVIILGGNMQTQETEKTKEKKCKDYVRGSCTSRYNDIIKLWEADCNGVEYVEDLGNIFEYGLCFDYVAPGTFRDQKVGYFRYQISWGGPSEEFRIFTNPDLSPYKIEFWYLDWFDGAKVTLSGKRFDKFSEFFTYFFVDTETAAHVLKEALTE